MSRRRSASYLVAAVILPVLTLFLGRLAAPHLPDSLLALYLYAAVLEVLMIGAPAVLLMLRKKGAYQGLMSSPSLYTSGLVVLAAVSYVLAAVLISSVWLGVLELTAIRLPQESSLPAASNVWELAAALFSAALVPAFCEELLFRAVLLRFIKDKAGSGWAVFICGLSFSLLHFSFRGFAALAVFGLFLCALTLRYRNLWLSIIFHFLYNALVIVLQSLNSLPRAQTILLFTGIFIAVTYLLFKKRRQQYETDGHWL